MHSQSRSDPLDLRGRQILITGGTGFVGRSLLDYLKEAQILYGEAPHVTVLTRTPDKFLISFPEYKNLSWLSFAQGDLMELPHIKLGQFTDIVHGAADTHAKSDLQSWLDLLVEGTKNVLNFARNSRVERLLFISSGAVYGAQPDEVECLSEFHPFAPQTTDVKSTYGNGKRIAEHLCALYAAQSSSPSCVIARCFAIVSKHIPLDGPYALGNFMRDAISGRSIFISGDGETIRSYIHGRDMAHWLFTLLCKGASGQAYNVGSNHAVTMLELAALISKAVNTTQPVKVSNNLNVQAKSVYIPCIDKAATLGLSIEISLEQAIEELALELQHG